MIAYDPYASAEKAAALGVTIVSFDEALARGDFFSLHMPLTPNTKGMFGDDAFAKVRPLAAIGSLAARAGSRLPPFAASPCAFGAPPHLALPRCRARCR